MSGVYWESVKSSQSQNTPGVNMTLFFVKAGPPVLYMLFWLWLTFYQLHVETVEELCELKPSRALSGQNNCFRPTQDSWDVALSQLQLHNSHSPNGPPSFCFNLGVHENVQTFYMRKTKSAKTVLPFSTCTVNRGQSGCEAGRKLFISPHRSYEQN